MNRCTHVFGETFGGRNGPLHRYCEICGLTAVRIKGEWYNELTLAEFSRRWNELGGTKPVGEIKILVDYLFEFNCYESWGRAYCVEYRGKSFGPRSYLVHLDRDMQEEFGEK